MRADTPFDSVESAQYYIGLLREAIHEAHTGVKDDIAAGLAGPVRHLEALRLVDHKLGELDLHIRATSRILNDLRMLRRILFSASEEA